MTDKFLEQILEYTSKNQLLPHGGLVLAAVSGGCDSMCLLHVLIMLSKELNFSVAAVHFNHLLRGEESDRDELFVHSHCESIGIPFYSGRGDVYSESMRRRQSIEETARNMRYSFFEKICAERAALKIATAHSADDNIETMLINFTRGTGISGLSGIPPRRGNIIRPLLCVTRRDIEQFLLVNDIPHVEDSTNSSDDYTRNKIRHHVVPILKFINPSLSRTAIQEAELIRTDDNYLCSLANNFIKTNKTGDILPAKGLSELPYPISSRVIKKLIPGLSKKHVDMFLGLCKSNKPSAQLSLPGITVRREYNNIIIGNPDKLSFCPFEIQPGETVKIQEANLKVICKKTTYSPNIHNSFNNFVLKYDSIQGAVLVRPRKSGDKISLINREGTKSLKKLYIDNHVPYLKRDLIPVIADELGVIAIYGFGIDKRNEASFGEPVLNIKIEEII